MVVALLLDRNHCCRHCCLLEFPVVLHLLCLPLARLQAGMGSMQPGQIPACRLACCAVLCDATGSNFAVCDGCNAWLQWVAPGRHISGTAGQQLTNWQLAAVLHMLASCDRKPCFPFWRSILNVFANQLLCSNSGCTGVGLSNNPSWISLARHGMPAQWRDVNIAEAPVSPVDYIPPFATFKYKSCASYGCCRHALYHDHCLKQK